MFHLHIFCITGSFCILKLHFFWKNLLTIQKYCFFFEFCRRFCLFCKKMQLFCKIQNAKWTCHTKKGKPKLQNTCKNNPKTKNYAYQGRSLITSGNIYIYIYLYLYVSVCLSVCLSVCVWTIWTDVKLLSLRYFFPCYDLQGGNLMFAADCLTKMHSWLVWLWDSGVTYLLS